jgi:hypothetical protein
VPTKSILKAGRRWVRHGSALAQLEDNMRALSVKLTSEDLKELDETSRPDWDYPWDIIRDAEAGDAKLLT